jgi:hypothetical protein
MPPHFGSLRVLLGGLAICFGACDGDHIGLNEQPPDLPAYPEIQAHHASLPRLTRAQYENVLTDVFGDELIVPGPIEPDRAVEGLIAIGATETSISARGVEQFESAAFAVAEQVADSVLTCEPTAIADAVCAREVLAPLGRRLWRRPLDKAELDSLVEIATDSATVLGDFREGLQFSIAALLQSPHFLFRVELADGPYGPYEMASRLSFFLWNTGPDEELLDAAKRGELMDDASLRRHAERMLESPRARHALRNFFTDHFELYRLDTLNKDPVVFVEMSSELGKAAREETLMVIEDLVFDLRGDYRDLFTTNKTFINRQLAAIYGVRAPRREGFGAHYWPENTLRSGILTHVSLLAGGSHPIDTSATLRGKFIRKKLLCGTINPPPVEVNPALPEPSGTTRTLKERVAEHLTNPVCAGCHSNMDPIGLGFENFDAIGKFRWRDNGVKIDASGELDGEPFADSRQLGEAIANHPRLPDCLVENLYRYATGHVDGDAEKALLNNLEERFKLQEYRVLELMVDIVMSPGFRLGSASDEEA